MSSRCHLKRTSAIDAQSGQFALDSSKAKAYIDPESSTAKAIRDPSIKKGISMQTEKLKGPHKSTAAMWAESGLSPGMIKWVRKEAGLTQQELGVLLSVASTTVSRWESSASCPHRANILALNALIDRVKHGEDIGEKLRERVGEIAPHALRDLA